MPHFELLPDEHVILELRRHPLVIFLDLMLFAFLFFIPVIAYAILIVSSISLADNMIIFGFVILGVSIFYLYIWLFTFHSLLDYVLDIWVVTNGRIIDMEQKGLFALSISEQEISRIQDMTVEINGILPTLFNFGNVYIQTAGEKERFIFRQVKDPRHVIHVLSTLMEENGQDRQ